MTPLPKKTVSGGDVGQNVLDVRIEFVDLTLQLLVHWSILITEKCPTRLNAFWK
jgi:hypothetical protein